MLSLLFRHKTVLILSALIFLPIVATYLGWDFKSTINWIRAQGLKAFIFTIPVHVLLSISPMSSDPIAFTNGLIYGMWVGATVNWIGSLSGSIVGYWLVYWGANEVHLSDYLAKLPRFISGIPVSSPLFLIGVRFVPFVGGDIVKYMAPAWKVPFGRYLWTSAVAIIPGAMLMAALGSGAIFVIERWLFDSP